jgi:succinate dehydrogenase / fumarate reductase cytochrome b subunit
VGYLTSSIGRKQLMGLSGLGLSLFVLTHMAGNMLIFVGPDAYNSYSHALITNKLIYVAEAGLVFLFLLHAITATWLTIENRRARPQGYYQGTNGAKAVCPASKTMAYQGVIILVFTILHLITFKYGTMYETTVNGVVMRDLHRLVLEVFHKPGYVAWYVVALIALGFHLSHGFASSFQSLGFNHTRYTPWLKCAGRAYAFIVMAGFLAQPLYVYFWH